MDGRVNPGHDGVGLAKAPPPACRGARAAPWSGPPSPFQSECASPCHVVCCCHDPLRELDFEAAIDLLLALNAAKTLNDLSPLKSVGLHKLKGDRKHQWAMTVNERWRICFEFREGDALDVEIVDYHRG